MNLKELAQLLNNCQIGEEGSPEIWKKAKDNNLVAVFGASDDLAEFYGAIEAEVGCYGGCTIYLDGKDIITNKCDDKDCPYFPEKIKNAHFIIKVSWNDDGDSDGFAWVFSASVPYETFDVFEGEDKYCRGIVFSLDILKDDKTFI